LLVLLSFLIFNAKIIDPAATEEDKIIPDNKISANNPPIKPPLSLKRLDFNNRINKIKVVALRLEIFNKVNGDKGLINIDLFKLLIQ
tara:strand:- start:68 stop:328 length:261 start_codon:yes stop_codon:yes gene_type:complete